MVITQTKIRSRYADTDQMKMVYYAKFFEYFEQGRADLLRDVGMPYSELEQMGYYLPVVEAHARYIKAVRYDDEVVVKTILKDMPQVKIRIEYELTNNQTGEMLAEGYTVHSFVRATTGKPTRAPDRFLELLTEQFNRTKSEPIP